MNESNKYRDNGRGLFALDFLSYEPINLTIPKLKNPLPGMESHAVPEEVSRFGRPSEIYTVAPESQNELATLLEDTLVETLGEYVPQNLTWTDFNNPSLRSIWMEGIVAADEFEENGYSDVCEERDTILNSGVIKLGDIWESKPDDGSLLYALRVADAFMGVEYTIENIDVLNWIYSVTFSCADFLIRTGVDDVTSISAACDALIRLLIIDKTIFEKDKLSKTLAVSLAEQIAFDFCTPSVTVLNIIRPERHLMSETAHRSQSLYEYLRCLKDDTEDGYIYSSIGNVLDEYASKMDAINECITLQDPPELDFSLLLNFE